MTVEMTVRKVVTPRVSDISTCGRLPKLESDRRLILLISN